MQAGLSWCSFLSFGSSAHDLPPSVGLTSEGEPDETPSHHALQDIRSALTGQGSLPITGSAAPSAATGPPARAVLTCSAAAAAVSKRRTALAAALEVGERRSPRPPTCTSVKPLREPTMSAESCVPRVCGSAESSKIQTPAPPAAASACRPFAAACGAGAGAGWALSFFSFFALPLEPFAALDDVALLFSMKSTRLCLSRPALKPGSIGESFAPTA
mmetsp:Transcript_54354/g.158677  ORF Transcript_54354/g.158677 Transcript_54354/m.158677 type:complete len:216 (+) Transcript_54354:157-804(+)